MSQDPAHLSVSGRLPNAVGVGRLAIAVTAGVLCLGSTPPNPTCSLAGTPALEQSKGKQSSTASIVVSLKVYGLRNNKGSVAAALFAREKGFPELEHAIQRVIVPVQGRAAALSFKGVPAGRYAVALLHDENGNGKMDFNLVGLPLEGYGFSNDAKPGLSPPPFSAAAFVLRRKRTLPIRMQYFFD